MRLHNIYVLGCHGGGERQRSRIRFFQKRGLTFKIVAAVLWPITFACCFYVGVFMYIPYGIYNVIMLIKKEPQVVESSVDNLNE